MLNISEISINHRVEAQGYRSLTFVESRTTGTVLIRIVSILFLMGFLIMFIPWTQNISSRGKVTTLKPDQKPQRVESVIGGRIERWYVQEGDLVKKGDTILHISEVKDDYFDPQLIPRTQNQLNSKNQSLISYKDKITALEAQISAMKQNSILRTQLAKNKLEQAKLKVLTDSIDLHVAEVRLQIASDQLMRMEELNKEGLKSRTDLEKIKLMKQGAFASLVAARNQLDVSSNDVLNASLELRSVQSKFQDEISKAKAEKLSAASSFFDSEAAVFKMENQLANYSRRVGMYFITAPQDGYIARAIKSGIGESIKEGAEILTLMPSQYDLGIEIFVKPIDMPLLKLGQHVRIQFDGWPAVVFSGWPNTSYGTYGGEIMAIDNFSDSSGLYRVLVRPDADDYRWPEELRVGSGSIAMILLGDVPVGYELWRKINGFPPDFYSEDVNRK